MARLTVTTFEKEFRPLLDLSVFHHEKTISQTLLTVLGTASDEEWKHLFVNFSTKSGTIWGKILQTGDNSMEQESKTRFMKSIFSMFDLAKQRTMNTKDDLNVKEVSTGYFLLAFLMKLFEVRQDGNVQRMRDLFPTDILETYMWFVNEHQICLKDEMWRASISLHPKWLAAFPLADKDNEYMCDIPVNNTTKTSMYCVNTKMSAGADFVEESAGNANKSVQFYKHAVEQLERTQERLESEFQELVDKVETKQEEIQHISFKLQRHRILEKIEVAKQKGLDILESQNVDMTRLPELILNLVKLPGAKECMQKYTVNVDRLENLAQIESPDNIRTEKATLHNAHPIRLMAEADDDSGSSNNGLESMTCENSTIDDTNEVSLDAEAINLSCNLNVTETCTSDVALTVNASECIAKEMLIKTQSCENNNNNQKKRIKRTAPSTRNDLSNTKLTKSTSQLQNFCRRKRLQALKKEANEPLKLTK